MSTPLWDAAKARGKTSQKIADILIKKGVIKEMFERNTERIDCAAKMCPFVACYAATINEHERLISRCREMMIHAGVYDESEFRVLIHRAEKESFEAARCFADCLPRIVMNYINERSTSR